MSRDLGPVTRAMSHEQALGQCRLWLRANNISPVAHSDTAGAAAWVADSDEVGLAALAPPYAAKLYGLTLHGTGMEDADHNMTRFVVLARAPMAAFGGFKSEEPPVGKRGYSTGSIWGF